MMSPINTSISPSSPQSLDDNALMPHSPLIGEGAEQRDFSGNANTSSLSASRRQAAVRASFVSDPGDTRKSDLENDSNKPAATHRNRKAAKLPKYPIMSKTLVGIGLAAIAAGGAITGVGIRDQLAQRQSDTAPHPSNAPTPAPAVRGKAVTTKLKKKHSSKSFAEIMFGAGSMLTGIASLVAGAYNIRLLNVRNVRRAKAVENLNNILDVV
jgi:hypothetical protein